MKRIAIVTGASSGMGQWFARTASEYVKFDQLWIIARRADRLEALAAELGAAAAGAAAGDAAGAGTIAGATAGAAAGDAAGDAAGTATGTAAGAGSVAGAAGATAGDAAGTATGTAAGAGASQEAPQASFEVRPVPMDLTSPQAIDSLAALLKEEGGEVVLLVNAAGFGKFQAVMDVPQQAACSMLQLNCEALMNMCRTMVPFMKSGAKILNIASVAAFQPVPYVTEYAATKAFVLNFSRGLWKELRPQGITVTALCPYWTRTEFFDVANNRDSKDRVSYFNAMYEPEDVVRRGWRDLMKGRDLSTFGFIARAQVVLVKLLPHRLVMCIWCRQQKIKE